MRRSVRPSLPLSSMRVLSVYRFAMKVVYCVISSEEELPRGWRKGLTSSTLKPQLRLQYSSQKWRPSRPCSLKHQKQCESACPGRTASLTSGVRSTSSRSDKNGEKPA